VNLSAARKDGDRKELWTPNMLASAAIARANGKMPLAKTRIRHAVASIRRTRAECEPEFGRGRPRSRRAPRKEHGL
jgi:hypothetical protein